MAESLNDYNLANVLANQSKWVQSKYNAAENAEKAMLEYELANAKKAIESENNFLGITLKEKVQELMVPSRVIEEIKDVAVNALTGATKEFFDWLKQNEEYYTENLFIEKVQANAKQIWYTRNALANEAKTEVNGQRFYASF